LFIDEKVLVGYVGKDPVSPVVSSAKSPQRLAYYKHSPFNISLIVPLYNKIGIKKNKPLASLWFILKDVELLAVKLRQKFPPS